MRKNINRETFQGRIYQKSGLEMKVTGETSKNPGTPYIAGNLDIAVDDEGLNVVTVHFTYVTEVWAKSGKVNNTYTTLKKIITEGKTWIEDGKDAATKVQIDGAIGLNDFYNAEDELVSAKVNEGSFVTIINNFDEARPRNSFEVDMLITGVNHVEREDEDDYAMVKGAIFNFRNELLPVEFAIRNDGGIKYFEDLDASASNPIYTKIWGKVNCRTSITTVEEEVAFGEPAVRTYERKSKSWDIVRSAKNPYDFGDENVLTAEELKSAMQARQTYLANVKKRSDEYRASKAAAPAVASKVAVKNEEFKF